MRFAERFGTLVACLSVPVVLLALVCLRASAAEQPSKPKDGLGPKAANRQQALKIFLQEHVRQIAPDLDERTNFSYAFVDLNGDGRDEAIVHVTGRHWCGTGGCQTYILTPNQNTYRFVARIPATRLPIRVLDSMSHGWRDITVIVREDAARMYEGELRFNGQKYPLDPRRAMNRTGKVVIPERPSEIPLFP
jgi:hypothetical protein